MPEDGNGFDQYKLLILDRFDRFDDRLDRLERQQERSFAQVHKATGSLEVQLATLKVKAGLAGLLAGAFGSVLVGVAYILMR